MFALNYSNKYFMLFYNNILLQRMPVVFASRKQMGHAVIPKKGISPKYTTQWGDLIKGILTFLLIRQLRDLSNK
jgi:hypothetical protein